MGWRYIPTHSLILALDGGELSTPTGYEAGTEHGGEEGKNPFSCFQSKSGHPASGLVTISNELSRHPNCQKRKNVHKNYFKPLSQVSQTIPKSRRFDRIWCRFTILNLNIIGPVA